MSIYGTCPTCGELFENECYCPSMKLMAWVSRHQPTDSQKALANSQGYILIPIGDQDAFSITHEWVIEEAVKRGLKFAAVAVVHPAAALRLAHHFTIGVFENANRAPEGAPPKFEAASLHLYQR